MKSHSQKPPQVFTPSTKFLFQLNPSEEEPPSCGQIRSARMLKYLWNIGNWLLVIPSRNSSDRRALKWIQIIHKITCGLSSSITIFLMITAVLSTARGFINRLHVDPSGLFHFFEIIAFIFFILTVYITGWGLGPKLHNLLQCEFYETRLDFWGWVLAALLYTSCKLSEFVEVLYFSPTEELVLKFRGRFEQHMFVFLSPQTRSALWDPYLNILCVVSYMSSKFGRMFGTVTVYGVIILHGSVVRRFCSRVHPHVSLSEFRWHYTSMQGQIEQLNGLVGGFVLGLSLHLFPMYMIWSTELFYDIQIDDRIRDKIGFCIDAVLYSGFYGMAAYNYQKVVRTVEETVLLHREDWGLSSGEFASFLYRAGHSELGVSGGGLFTITHKCIGSVLSMMLTYTIILIQFKSPGNSVKASM